MKTIRLTTKTKKEIRYFTNLFLLLIASMCLLASLTSCRKDTDPVKNCGTPATIRDLSGLDGCGFVLELENGERLEPVTFFRCGNDPNLFSNNSSNFTWKDGLRVTIGYRELKDRGSICMVGKMVEITCIEVISTSKPD
jgi:hypothetical protein